jgi:hypothetical protein
LDFNALHRVGGAMEAVLRWKRLYHDWPSSKPDDYAAYTYSDTSGPPAKCYTISSLFLIKRRHRQDNWNLHLYRDTNWFRFLPVPRNYWKHA